MPPRLNMTKIASIATVDEDFVEELKRVWEARLKALKKEAEARGPYKDKYLREKKMTIARLLSLRKPENLDKEITRLRGLQYEHFYTRVCGDKKYLCGLTKPIVMDTGERMFQAPRYKVCVPVSPRLTSVGFHMIPEGYEFVRDRAPHHIAVTRRLTAIDPHEDPLEMFPHTCWGAFGEAIQSILGSADIVDLFRTIHVYLSRIDERSMLVTSLLDLPFLKEIDRVQKSRRFRLEKR